MRHKEDEGRRSGDYEVGYGKPPKATQFKPGQSGNPKGRPKAALSHAEEATALMSERVAPKSGGKKITRRRQALQAMYVRALQGNVAAFRELMRLDAEGLQKLAPQTVGQSQVDEESQRFIHALKLEFGAQAASEEELETQ